MKKRRERSADYVLATIGIVAAILLSCGVGYLAGATKPLWNERFAPFLVEDADESSAGNKERHTPCLEASRLEESDLCAQWRAATAGERAARAAQWGNLLSFLGALASAGGLLALVVTIQQGRSALRRARKANRIARKTAEHELRAYIAVTLGEMRDVADRSQPKCFVNVKNVGATPALKVSIQIDSAIFDTDYIPEDAVYGVERDFTLHPGQDLRSHLECQYSLAPGALDALAQKTCIIWVWGKVEYVDIFDKNHVSNFCHIYSGTNLNKGFYYRHGNSAS